MKSSRWVRFARVACVLSTTSPSLSSPFELVNFYKTTRSTRPHLSITKYRLSIVNRKMHFIRVVFDSTNVDRPCLSTSPHYVDLVDQHSEDGPLDILHKLLRRTSPTYRTSFIPLLHSSPGEKLRNPAWHLHPKFN